jgi:hypothetical protein
MFGGAFEHGLFAVQVVINAYGDEELRKKIHACIQADVAETPNDKRRYYKQLTALLVEAEPHFEFACFTYDRDPDTAVLGYRQWVSELEAAMATEPIETGDDVDGYHRLSKEQSYIVVTLVLLLTEPHPWDHKGQLGYDTERGRHTFDPEDNDDYTRPNIGALIDSVNYIDFENVEADATFLMPGSDQDGFSWADLADEGWAHLVMLRS